MSENSLYLTIFELKQELEDDCEITLFVSNDLNPIIATEDHICCMNGLLIIKRKKSKCIIPLDKVLMVSVNRRWL